MAGIALHALHDVLIVVIAPVLYQDRLFDPVQVHLVQDHLHRFEPNDAGVAMGVDDRRVPLALFWSTVRYLPDELGCQHTHVDVLDVGLGRPELLHDPRIVRRRQFLEPGVDFLSK